MNLIGDINSIGQPFDKLFFGVSSLVFKNLFPTPTEWPIKDGGIVASGNSFTYPGGDGLKIAYFPTTGPKKDHKYYCRFLYKTEPGFSCADGRVEFYNTTYDGVMTFDNAVWANRDTNGSWITIASIMSVNVDTYETIEGQFRHFMVNPIVNAYRKQMLLVDLTDTFGAGNEPSNEWCNEFIPYFLDELILPVASITGKAFEVHKGFVGISGNIAKKWYERSATSQPQLYFFINDITYSFNNGMTLATWVNSSYNESGWYVGSDNYLYKNDGVEKLIDTNGNPIIATTALTVGTIYKTLIDKSKITLVYTGDYTTEEKVMDGITYRVYAITGPGQVQLNIDQATCDIWMCGGGANGVNAFGTGSARFGGGSGYVTYKKNVTLGNNDLITIGAGGGGTTSIKGVANLSAAGGNGKNGGSGGGAGGKSGSTEMYAEGGTGAGVSTTPFDGTYVNEYWCAGGGGGGRDGDGVNAAHGGAAGGSNGSNGNRNGTSSLSGVTTGGIGGIHGGGAGAYAKHQSGGSLQGGNATTYGSGGGGPSSHEDTAVGNGMQGVVLIRIPISGTSTGTSVPLDVFMIAGTVYYCTPGMTWGDWVGSSYNTGGFVTSGTSIKAGTGFFANSVNSSGTAVVASEAIRNGEYYYA